jgi:hypothetical protein
MMSRVAFGCAIVAGAMTAVIGLLLWSLTTDLNEGNKLPLDVVVLVTCVLLSITIALIIVGVLATRSCRS